MSKTIELFIPIAKPLNGRLLVQKVEKETDLGIILSPSFEGQGEQSSMRYFVVGVSEHPTIKKGEVEIGDEVFPHTPPGTRIDYSEIVYGKHLFHITTFFDSELSAVVKKADLEDLIVLKDEKDLRKAKNKEQAKKGN